LKGPQTSTVVVIGMIALFYYAQEVGMLAALQRHLQRQNNNNNNNNNNNPRNPINNNNNNNNNNNGGIIRPLVTLILEGVRIPIAPGLAGDTASFFIGLFFSLIPDWYPQPAAAAVEQQQQPIA